MDKKKLLTAIDQVLVREGFKRRGNRWEFQATNLLKVIELQKSNFGNQFFINYGFIIVDVDLGGLAMHLYMRMAAPEKEKNKLISRTFDLELPIDDIERVKVLHECLYKYLLDTIIAVNSIEELRAFILSRNSSSDVPLVTKKYLGIPIE